MGATQSTEVKEKKKGFRESDQSQATDTFSSNEVYPTPKGNEYDAIDKIAAELPNVIDDESRQQVEDYKQACDNGKGPMVRTTTFESCVIIPTKCGYRVQRFVKVTMLTEV
jgi:hypothetical protein